MDDFCGVFDCRGCKVLEVRLTNDEDRIVQVETELQATILFGEEADRKYEEVTTPTAGRRSAVSAL